MTNPKSTSLLGVPNRRQVLRAGGAALLTTPFVSRAWASTTEINMLAWYGHGEPDIVAEYEAANNVKFVPKYYAGGDNMLALIAQSDRLAALFPTLQDTRCGTLFQFTRPFLISHALFDILLDTSSFGFSCLVGTSITY